MKASYNWIREFLEHTIEPAQLSEILTQIGLEVEGEEQFESIPGGLEGIVVGEVLTCEQHPNADRLSLTQVKVDEDTTLQIVCGAPNVKAGIKVLVATPGTTLYGTDGSSFKIKKTKLRGVDSNGMICAEDELGLGTSHDGIMILDDATLVGTAAAKLYDISSDTVFEIGLTPNRSDAMCQLGVAKDLHAYMQYHQIGQPEWKYQTAELPASNQSSDFTVEVLDTQACPRYAGIIMRNVKVEPSPDWMQNHLKSIGLKPINNIVDISNFVLHGYGKALHIFDLDKIHGNGLKIQKAQAGTKFTTLDHQEIELTAEDLLICDKSDHPLCLAGIYGGAHAAVTAETTNIFIESAYFDAETIRKSSMHHQLRTDAAKRFEKGDDISYTLDGLAEAIRLINELTGAGVDSQCYDVYPDPILPLQIFTRFDRVRSIIGNEISNDAITRLAQDLKMQIIEQRADGLVLQIPQDKADVTREIDVIEELLRIYGYDQVVASNVVKMQIDQGDYATGLALKEKLFQRLNGLGLHQMMNISLSQSKYYDAQEGLVFIQNTSNSHLNIMRPDMLMSAIETVSFNFKRQQRDLKLFEFGRIYHKMDEGGYEEQERLALCVMGRQFGYNWKQIEASADFFYLKGLVAAILPQQSHIELEYVQSKEHLDATWECRLGEEIIGYLGVVNRALLEEMDVKQQELYFASFDWAKIQAVWDGNSLLCQPISKYPAVNRDLSYLVSVELAYESMIDMIKKYGGKNLISVELFDVFKNKQQLGEGKQSMAFHLTFESMEGTLQDKKIDKICAKITAELTQNLDVELRD